MVGKYQILVTIQRTQFHTTCGLSKDGHGLPTPPVCYNTTTDLKSRLISRTKWAIFMFIYNTEPFLE
uniref:Uncharacterized protein n=1 Tax=Nelumbo nucifera TaxID=4432 RepID=A0A822YWY4_NELNU|nr:TPA_asm: hypothetical protein HUJ06_005906 [Nelumbo nucifera]